MRVVASPAGGRSTADGRVQGAGVPAQFDQGYGTEYLRGFRTAWMLK